MRPKCILIHEFYMTSILWSLCTPSHVPQRCPVVLILPGIFSYSNLYLFANLYPLFCEHLMQVKSSLTLVYLVHVV